MVRVGRPPRAAIERPRVDAELPQDAEDGAHHLQPGEQIVARHLR